MKKQSLKDIANIIMGQSPSGASCNINGFGEPLLNGPTEFGSYNPIPKQFTNAGTRYCDYGDILFCVRGSTTGRMNWADRSYVLGRGLAAIKHKYDKDLNHYLKYLIEFNLRSILKSTSGSTFPNLSKDSLQDFNFAVLENDDQKNLSHFLRTIDQKIELNNRINRELEGMAKLLYDYWFVQFDFPISEEQAIAMGKPELKGKPYKSSGGAMVYKEELKREVPEGWEVKELIEVANITMGQSPFGQSYNSDQNGIVFFQGSTDFGWRFPLVRQYTTAPGRIAEAGDILLSVRAPVGTLNIADQRCCIGRGLAALSSKEGFTSYLYYVMEYFKRIFDYHNNIGTTFGSITKNDLHSLKLVYPASDLLKEYNSVVAQQNGMILNNHRQNLHLKHLRDWLLPMLMNGQVRVSTKATEEYKIEGEVLMAAEVKRSYK